MAEASRSYVPPAGKTWALPLYDPFAWLMGADRARDRLVAQAALGPGMRVLDVGCGTGTLLVRLRAARPDLEVVGIDPDPGALVRARRKVARAGVTVQLDQGFGDALPYPDASFDRVFSSYMLHHLEPDQKRGLLREIHRVLRPGGSLHLLDFGGGHGHHALAAFAHARPRLGEQLGDGVLAVLRESAFPDAAEVHHARSLAGPTAWYRAPRP